MAALIQARDLSKTFGLRRAIDDVDLDVSAGVCFGLLGPNGAGKTTLIRMLLGLARPSAGAVTIGGIDVASDPHAALAPVGAIVEEPRFHLHLTGRENLRVHAALLGPEARQRIADQLARVGLTDRADERVKGYSLGMRQRLGVARALLGDPALLVLDEPTNGLDAQGMVDFRALIRDMVEREARTVFVSSHLLGEMQKLCDEVAIIEEGRVSATTSMRSLLEAGERTLRIDCDDPGRARELLMGAMPDGGEIVIAADGRLELAGVADRAQVVELNRLLVGAGIGVAAIGVETQTLEQRFLDLTGQDLRGPDG